MSLGNIFNIGVSGLMTAQQRLRVTSDNISNVNTEGYIRKLAPQEALVISGAGTGVGIASVQLASDRFLQQAALGANSDASAASARYDMLDQIQAQFGDITDSNSLFSQGNTIISNLLQAAESPDSTAMHQQVITSVSNFLNEAARLSDNIQSVRQNMETQIDSDVDTVNQLLSNISKLNESISSATIGGSDATGAINAQSGYIDQLSKYVDVVVSQSSTGAVTLKTQKGLTLVSINGPSTLEYESQRSVDASTSFSSIMLTTADGATRDLNDNLTSGELKGLIEVRDKDTVDIQAQLNEYVTTFSDALNEAHNQSSAVPAPASLTGKATNLTQSEAMSGLTGATNFVTLDSSGNITHTLTVDFTNKTLSLDGGATSAFADASFDTDVTAKFGGAATLSFSNGAMSLTASGSSSNDGVAIVDPTTGGATKLGQGFSHYFGMNDLVTASVPTSTSTGLTATSNHGFTAGDKVSFRLSTANGGKLADIDVAIPSGSTMTDLVNALNNTSTGVGRYGTFSLDSSTGTLSFKGFSTPSNSLSVISDSTSRLGTGDSLSEFFGIAGYHQKVVDTLEINSNISGTPSNLALAKVNLSATSGQKALLSGNGQGAALMAAIKDKSLSFGAAGSSNGGMNSLEAYASDLAGQIGNMAAQAKSLQASAETLSNEASARRSSVEGVNLDEELVNLTTFQQAYSASSRVIQAAKDMFDILLKM